MMPMLIAASVLYLSPVIGTGTDADPQRLALNSYGPGGMACIPTDPATGKNRFAWGLARSPRRVPVDASIIVLPDVELDEPINLSLPGWAILKAALNARGADTTGLSRTSTLRQIGQAVLDVLADCPNFLDGRVGR